MNPRLDIYVGWLHKPTPLTSNGDLFPFSSQPCEKILQPVQPILDRFAISSPSEGRELC